MHSSAAAGAADAVLHNSSSPPTAAAAGAVAARDKVVGGPGLAAFMPGTDKGSDVPRVNVGVFGIMNAGKSTLMNAITRQETSIVDATPGTTADVKAALMELHDIGPCKLFDTAGVDETGELGEKKRKKALSTLKETDVALIVVDVARQGQAAAAGEQQLRKALKWELELLAKAEQHGVVPLLVLNLKGAEGADPAIRQRVRGVLDPEQEVLTLELDLGGAAAAGTVPDIVATFLQEGVMRSRKRPATRSLPDWVLTPQSRVFLNIPMDAETPSMRLLRPQALVQEEAIRHWASTTAYRMDLAAARSGDPVRVAAEKARFMASLEPLLSYDGPKLLVTDSQVRCFASLNMIEAGQWCCQEQDRTIEHHVLASCSIVRWKRSTLTLHICIA
jgi:small GTP-binding protein